MATGESQLTGDRFLPKDICDSGVPPDAVPVVSFESSNEEEILSEPEVCVFLNGVDMIQVSTCLHIITDVIQIVVAFC